VGEPTVLIVEDDPAIGEGLRTALRAQGYTVTWCAKGVDALGTEGSPFDLALLDLGLPDMDGLDVCRRLRAAQAALTIVMLTARTDEASVIAGLDAGADDYLTKPFRLAELQARVRAHLRRPRVPVVPVGHPLIDPVAAGSLRIDRAARRAWVDDRELDLRAKEFDLLHLLAENAGRALTRDMIMRAVWHEHFVGSTKTLDMHILALRRKIGDGSPITITTLRRVGYRLEAP
jgi:DNA-binding response OmpR family regulator